MWSLWLLEIEKGLSESWSDVGAKKTNDVGAKKTVICSDLTPHRASDERRLRERVSCFLIPQFIRGQVSSDRLARILRMSVRKATTTENDNDIDVKRFSSLSSTFSIPSFLEPDF